MPELSFSSATSSRWKHIEELFGERGACGGCWCMAWRLSNKDWVAGKGTKNKRAFKRIVTSGERPGVLGYLGKRPVAWCAVAPREVYTTLARSRVLKPIDDRRVWSVSCLFVLRPFRRQGISGQILRAAVDFVARRGGRIVEGYPVRPTMNPAPDPFLWTGTPLAFRRAGFRVAARPSKARVIMRYTIDARGARKGARQ